MKKGNVVLIICLLALVTIGWTTTIRGYLLKQANYNEAVSMAQEYIDKGLYQKAILCYDDAIKIKDSIAIREQRLDSYVSAYAQGVVDYNTLLAQIEELCDLNPESSKYWEQLIHTCLSNNDYSRAYDYYRECKRNGANSDNIQRYSTQILYYFNTVGTAYDEYVRNASGYFMVYDGRKWGVVRPNGRSRDYKIYHRSFQKDTDSQ